MLLVVWVNGWQQLLLTQLGGDGIKKQLLVKKGGFKFFKKEGFFLTFSVAKWLLSSLPPLCFLQTATDGNWIGFTSQYHRSPYCCIEPVVTSGYFFGTKLQVTRWVFVSLRAQSKVRRIMGLYFLFFPSNTHPPIRIPNSSKWGPSRRSANCCPYASKVLEWIQ